MYIYILKKKKEKQKSLNKKLDIIRKRYNKFDIYNILFSKLKMKYIIQ